MPGIRVCSPRAAPAFTVSIVEDGKRMRERSEVLLGEGEVEMHAHIWILVDLAMEVSMRSYKGP